jgi:hypothetical protein
MSWQSPHMDMYMDTILVVFMFMCAMLLSTENFQDMDMNIDSLDMGMDKDTDIKNTKNKIIECLEMLKL